jgi:UDP-GlcNAc:undecaprenyl-phosphate GlcNAc-1-phosphate transferase
MSWFAVGGIIVIAGTNRFMPQKRKSVLRVVLYCLLPFLMYVSTTDPAEWLTENIAFVNHGAFVALIFLVIATLNLTKRQKGFRFNPLDFLIFVVIIVLPNLPSIHLETPLIKVVVAKVLILFFSYDVLLGELRQEDFFLDKNLIAAFAVIVIRGFI